MKKILDLESQIEDLNDAKRRSEREAELLKKD